MYHTHSVSELRELLSSLVKDSAFAFVPTMGSLHDGHLSLIRHAIKDGFEWIVISIFVNPTQFSPNEDFDQYPRTLAHDISLLKAIDSKLILFTPPSEAIYPADIERSTKIIIPQLNERLCGQSRPDFFNGVCSICLRLFNIIRPSSVYFGEKDFQQLRLIQKMVADLFLNISIIGCPIVREKNGLAMSSRNQYLSIDDRDEASIIYHMLKSLKTQYEAGTTHTHPLIQAGKNILLNSSQISIDYLEIIDSDTLNPISYIQDSARIVFAGHLKNTRLIDNIELR